MKQFPHQNGYPVVHWTHLHGNRYMTSVKPEMLSPDGHTEFKLVRLTGQKHHENRITAYVRYDREYVVTKMAILLNELRSIGFNELQKVFAEAWHFGKARLEEHDEF